MIYFIYRIQTHLFHGNIWTHNLLALNVRGLMVQLVRASHPSASRRHGFKSVEVLNFFRLFHLNTINSSGKKKYYKN